MNAPGSEEARLGAALRAALAGAEPAAAPEFAHLWTRAAAARRRPARSFGWHAAAAAAGAIAAVALWSAREPADSGAQSDYRLALAVAAGNGLRTPTDRWLAEMPSAPTSGLPTLPAVAYPLLPEETLL